MHPAARASALVLLATVLSAALPASSGQPEAVATTIDLRGQVTCRQEEGPWYAAWQDQRNRLHDHVKTGADSTAALEFDIGGRLGVNQQTEIVLLGGRDAEAVNQGTLQRISLQMGSIWAKVTRQRQELQVHTSGGVMGIKGTEFVVETDPNQGTTLTVLEGSVELTPDTGEVVLATPGDRIRFARDLAPLRQRVEDLQALRTELEGRFSRVRELRTMLEGAREQYVPMAQRTRQVVLDTAAEARRLGYAGAATARQGAATARQGAATARQNAEYARQLLGQLGVGGAAQGGSGAGGAQPPARLDFASDLDPDGADLGSRRPTFNWSPVDGAVLYGLVVSRSDAMLDPVWAAKSPSPTVEYPSNGRPLEPGSYLWRVIPLDAQGRPVGRASQGSFTTSGWTPPSP